MLILRCTCRKLVFAPREQGQAVSIARPEWGVPDPFGSAAKAAAVVHALARKRARTAVLQQHQE